MKAFAEKYEYYYSDYNHGRNHLARKRNKRFGKRKMRNRLKKQDLKENDIAP